jgi:lipopolysaccharide export LptBFGC system permease protein LptF
VRGEEGTILYHYEDYFPKDKIFHDVSVFEMKEDPYRIARRSFAREVQWKEGTWEMRDGWTREFSADRSVYFSEFKKKDIPFLEHPDYFNRKWKPLNYMGPGELREYEQYLTLKGEDTQEVKVEEQKKYAFPFTPLVMGILGIPFSFLIGKKGALYGIGLSILLGIFYWAFMAFFSFLGEVGVLPPELSAWSPNVIFGIAGVYLILALRS